MADSQHLYFWRVQSSCCNFMIKGAAVSHRFRLTLQIAGNVVILHRMSQPTAFTEHSLWSGYNPASRASQTSWAGASVHRRTCQMTLAHVPVVPTVWTLTFRWQNGFEWLCPPRPRRWLSTWGAFLRLEFWRGGAWWVFRIYYLLCILFLGFF